MDHLLGHQFANLPVKITACLNHESELALNVLIILSRNPGTQVIVDRGDSALVGVFKSEYKSEQAFGQVWKLMCNSEALVNHNERLRCTLREMKLFAGSLETEATIGNGEIQNLMAQWGQARCEYAFRTRVFPNSALFALLQKDCSWNCCCHQYGEHPSNRLEPGRVIHGLCDRHAAPAIEQPPCQEDAEAGTYSADDEKIAPSYWFLHGICSSPDVVDWSLGRSLLEREAA